MDLSAYDIEAARRRIEGLALRTPLLPSVWLSDHTGSDVRLKLECLQNTGSFKLRGAANKLLGLDEAAARKGVIATSSGNHGFATAWVAGRLGIPATICVPEWVDPAKLRAIRGAGAEAVVEGATAEESETVSLELQRQRGLTYVHPFDDPVVIAGQGTLGAEILEQLDGVDTVVVPLSGGGLMGGVAAAIRQRAPGTRLVAAYAERAPVMVRSVAAGRLVSMPEEETLATALSGNLGEDNRHSLRLVSELVDDFIGVSEEQIADAMRFAFDRHRLVVEGGGAVGIAAVQSRGAAGSGGRTVVVVSGGNIDIHRLYEVITRGDDDAAGT